MKRSHRSSVDGEGASGSARYLRRVESARTKYLISAFFASFVSKAATLILAFVALPLVARVLDAEAFAAFGMTIVVLAWSGTISPVLGPTAAVMIARGRGEGQEGEVSATITALLASSLIVGFASALATILALPLAFAVDLPTTIAIAVSVLFFNIAAGIDLVRLGFQRAQRSSLWAAIATIIGAATTIVIYFVAPSAWLFVVTVYAVPLVIRTASLHDLDAQAGVARLLRRSGTARAVRTVASGNLFHLATQLGVFAGYPLALLLFKRMTDDDRVGSLFVTQTIAVSAIGILSAAVQPLSGAAADASSTGDIDWIRRTVRRILLLSAAASAVGTIAAFAIGSPIARLLFADKAPTVLPLVLIGLSVGVANASMTIYQVLLGLRAHRVAAASQLPGIALTIAVVTYASSIGSVSLAVAGAGILPGLVSTPLMWIAFRKHAELQSHGHQPSAVTTA